MNQDFVSRKQLLLLPERIQKAEASEASKEMHQFLWKMHVDKKFGPMTIMVVGDDGSYPAAVSVSHSLRCALGIPDVEAATPQTALRILSQPGRILKKASYDVVIGISYSGKTPDIKAVYNSCRIRDFPFVLFTGADKEALKEEYFENKFPKIVSYFNADDTTGKEIGISMFSTLAPVILFDHLFISYDHKLRNYNVHRELLEKGEKFVSRLDIPKIARAIKSQPIIHVIYEWRTYALALDIASKFMKSGIANVILHEKKDFSYGCYTLLYQHNFAMVINFTQFAFGINTSTGEIMHVHSNDYDKELDKFLKDICQKKDAFYMEMGNGFETASMLIEELCKLPYLVTAIGDELGVDISKPFGSDRFPEEPKALCEFNGDF